MKKVLRWLYRKRYGVRGGLEPPLGFYSTNHVSVFRYAKYRYGYRMWQMEEALYRLTGLPDAWTCQCNCFDCRTKREKG